MVQGNFNWSNNAHDEAEIEQDLSVAAGDEEKVVKRVEVLKEKLSGILRGVRLLRAENVALEQTVRSLKAELGVAKERVALLEENCDGVERMKVERDKLMEERVEVRSQIEDLLQELEGIELG